MDKYILLHKDHAVAEFSTKRDTVLQAAIYKENIKELPLPLKRLLHNPVEFIESEDQTKYTINDDGCWLMEQWISDREIPANRDNLSKYLERGKTAREWMLENNAFSFTDCYWIKKERDDLCWSDIVAKKQDVDNLSLTHDENRLYHGVNSTLGGELEKYWFTNNGELWICKKTPKPYDVLNARELMASLIYEKQGYTKACHYDFVTDKTGDIVGCACKAFTDNQTELVTAYDLLEEYNMTQQDDVYEKIIDYSCAYGMDRNTAEKYMDMQTLVDYIITNRDRHQGNIGFLRDADTLQIIDVAPIFDSGSSKHLEGEQPEDTIHTKVNSLYPTEGECLSHVKDYFVLDVSKLPTIDEIEDILNQCSYISEYRKDQLLSLYEQKVDYVLQMQDRQLEIMDLDDTER